MKTPRLDATGVFIPVAIWEHQGLSWLEKCLYAEIHALGGHQGRCGASNEFLAEAMGMTAGSVAVSISTFRKLNLIKDVTGKNKRNLKTCWEPLVMAKDALAIAKPPLVMANPPIIDNKVDISCVTPEQIYAAYPLKVARPKAIEAISKAMKKTTPERLLKLTQDFARARANYPDYMPMPATWYNQERFNDDPSTWVRTNDTIQEPQQTRYF